MKELPVRQTIALIILIVITLVFKGTAMAVAASNGNWGGALGVILGAVVLFYFVQAIVFFGRRLIRGHSAHGFSQSRLNYFSLGVAALAVVSSPLPAGG